MSARVRTAAVALCFLWTGCHGSSAIRHAGATWRDGWDVAEHGAGVVLRGPLSTLRAGGELVWRSMVPARVAEPRETWFRFYTGPMQPLAKVAVLCSVERAVHVHTIRPMEGATRYPARYRSWHFPLCIEAMPGVYEIEVHYFLRRTDDVRDASSTRHAESVEPSRVAWYAEGGGVYRLRASVGTTGPSAAPAPRSRVSRRSSLGTARFELEEGEWVAEIERLASWGAVDAEVLEHRAAWQRYERLQPLDGRD